ncbi:MAG: TonB-dependent receptor [Candidatus Neomarinimicrobiota bacterium]
MKRFRSFSLTTRAVGIVLTVLVLVSGSLWGVTTGKLAGRVLVAETGEPLAGVDVVVVGTVLGAATDADGNYTILNVPPGTYSLRASYIGYAQTTVEGVKVNLNLTTTVDYGLQVEAVAGEEVTVVAERPIVQPDISANIANVSAEDIEFVPIAGITEFINLQAGIEPGMRIRGAGTDNLAFVVDGASMRDARSNRPFSNVSYTAIDEVQIQTGGFSAEYGNVQSGLINVVTKDPPRNRYIADVLLRYTPAQPMSFGGTAKDDNAYYWRPYTDPDVMLVGTENGPWDTYTQRQYPKFDGWTSFAEGSPLTAEQLQEVFAWHTRKSVEIEEPEYDIDATLGGPLVPGLGGSLGGLRFLASYRQTQDPYLFPQARKVATTNTAQLKLLADLGPSMKLTLSALRGEESGTAHAAFATVENELPQEGGIPSYPWSLGGQIGEEEAGNNMYSEPGGHVARSTIFGTDRYAITDVTRAQFGASFTHALNSRTFYQIRLNRMVSNYDSHPDSRRDELESVGEDNGNALKSFQIYDSSGVAIPDSFYYLDSAPFGWTSSGTSNPGSALRLGGHWARARDTSVVAVTTIKFDLTNQINSFNELQSGLELILYDFDMNYGSDDSVIVHIDRSKQRWERNTTQFALYVQDKLEFKGMIANVGLRLDYYNPGKDWWKYDAFERVFNSKGRDTRDDELEKEDTDKQTALSPRIGVSFPITVNSKLFFNYGHFRDILVQREQFQISTQWQGNIGNIGNPNHPLKKTVSYELGYEQNLLDQYLLRLSGYYNDRSNLPEDVYRQSIDGEVHYVVSQPRHYGDVRGLEITLNKIRGRWFRGFVNYTYMVEKEGNFGLLAQFENDVTQLDYERTTEEHYQQKPIAQPFARADLEFILPATFGPRLIGTHLLGDWHLNVLSSWRAGDVFTWGGRGGVPPGLRDNVRMRDFMSVDLRFSKNFDLGLGRTQFFVDVANVFNLKYMYFHPDNRQPFEGLDDELLDYSQYMESLHLSKDVFEDIDNVPYIFIDGDDRPGDYRNAGVAFVPIEITADKDNLPTFDYLEPDRRVLGWVEGDKTGEGTYYEYNKNTDTWETASSSFVDQVLDDKAYIDMPNETYRTFLNPRKILFGIRVSF